MGGKKLISRGTVVTVDPELGDIDRGAVLVEDGAITAVGPDLGVGDAEVIDATDCIVMPGFVDAHRHTWQTLFRNVASDWTLAHSFTGLHGTMSGLYRPEDTDAGNLIGTLEALESGITTLLDWSHNLGHGWPATGRLLDAGIRPSLSIDVCCSNGGHMFGTIGATIGTERGFDNQQARERGEPSVSEMEPTCRDVLEFATIEGARACGLEGKIGSLTPGKRADVIVIRADSFGMTPLDNPVGQVVYNAHPGLVDTVLVDGNVVKRGGDFVDVDSARVRRLAVESRDDILRRASGQNGAKLGGDWIPKPYAAVEA